MSDAESEEILDTSKDDDASAAAVENADDEERDPLKAHRIFIVRQHL
jgi:hypothetical protein